jgi:hypothetical protein
MNPLTVVNVIASGVLAAGVSAFMIMLYRSDGVVRRWPLTGSLLLRLSLVATASGSLLNCLTMSTPPISEIIVNCGLAGVFSWGVYFHYKLIKRDVYGPDAKHLSGTDEGSSR